MSPLSIEILDSPAEVARRGAEVLAAEAREAIASRGKCGLAVSGGKTPGAMFEAWATHECDWDKIHLLQVDERLAPAGSADRNLTQLRQSLLGRTASGTPQVYAMPVEAADLEAAAAAYAQTLRQLCGNPPVLDLVHLGLGADGHTASIFPHDPVADRVDADVVITAEHSGYRRMTLTRAVLDAARRILWIVTGAEKASVLRRLVAEDESIPAGLIRQDAALVLADRAAAAELSTD
jgi:6-phosphogluconolactonase